MEELLMKIINHRTIAGVVFALLWLFLTFREAEAPIFGVPRDEMRKEWLQTADAVYAGTAFQIADGRPGKLPVGKSEINGQWVLADFRVDDVIKGPAAEQVSVEFFRPPDTFVTPMASVPPKVRCLLFLKSADEKQPLYRLLEPRGPTGSVIFLAPEPPLGLDKKTDAAERLSLELVNTVLNGKPGIAISAIHNLKTLEIPKEIVLPALQTVSKDKNPELMVCAIATRISIGDKTAVTEAMTLVEAGKCSEPQRQEIGDSMRDLTAPEYVDQLNQIFHSKDVFLRRGAIYALRQSKATNAVLPILGGALQDVDTEVKYHAMMGIARRIPDGTGTPPAPAYRLFLEKPQEYLLPWLAWWDKNKDRYPGETPDAEKRN